MKIAYIAKLNPQVEKTINVPGSKSYTLRALFISALCEKRPQLSGLLDSKDVKAMSSCLEHIQDDGERLFAGESGITARFITALCCITPGKHEISGAPGLLKRPIGDLVEALRNLGAKIDYKDQKGFLPIVVSSNKLSGNKVTISGQTSSQFLSALLLIAPLLENGLEIAVTGKQISKPYIDITIDIMSRFGVTVNNDNYERYIITRQRYNAESYQIEGDYSSAAYFYAINALCGSNIKVGNTRHDSKQGDKKFTDMLSDGSLPQTINVEDFPDQAMTLAVLSAFNKEKTIIDGVSSLRVKETERVQALENELAKMGIKTESTQDRLIIYGGSPKPAHIDSYNDHRIAMSFAVAAVKLGNIRIFRPEVVEKTFPDFWQELSKITEVEIKDLSINNLLLTGMRGSGKTTIGKILAKKLSMNFIDMDEFIEEKQGSRIRDIVEKNGWEFFRKLETQACRELSQLKNTVIASGGGAILKEENMAQFDENTLNLLFVANPSLLSERISGDHNRYELTEQPTLLGELGEVWKKRKEKYFMNADFVIDTSNGTPQSVTEDIMDRLGL